MLQINKLVECEKTTCLSRRLKKTDFKHAKPSPVGH